MASKYRSQADFQKLNGDESQNESIKSKYGVNSYPRLIFTDATGAKLDEIKGAPDRQEFETKVKGMLGKS